MLRHDIKRDGHARCRRSLCVTDFSSLPIGYAYDIVVDDGEVKLLLLRVSCRKRNAVRDLVQRGNFIGENGIEDVFVADAYVDFVLVFFSPWCRNYIE